MASCPSITGSFLRFPLGGIIDKSGGSFAAFIYLCLAVLGMLIMTVLAFASDIAEMSPSAAPYYFWCLGGLLAGMGVATFPMIINVLYWSTNAKAGTN